VALRPRRKCSYSQDVNVRNRLYGTGVAVRPHGTLLVGQDYEDPNGGSPLGLPNDLQCLTDASWVVKVSLSLAQVSSSQSRVSLMLGPRVLCTEIPRPLAPTGSFPEEGFLGAVALKIPHRLPAA